MIQRSSLSLSELGRGFLNWPRYCGMSGRCCLLSPRYLVRWQPLAGLWLAVCPAPVGHTAVLSGISCWVSDCSMGGVNSFDLVVRS